MYQIAEHCMASRYVATMRCATSPDPFARAIHGAGARAIFQPAASDERGRRKDAAERARYQSAAYDERGKLETVHKGLDHTARLWFREACEHSV